MKVSKTLIATIVVLVLSGTAAVLEWHGQHSRQSRRDGPASSSEARVTPAAPEAPPAPAPVSHGVLIG